MKNDLLSPNQHGIRKGYSTATAFICLLDEIYRAIDEGYFICVIFLDFSKAFDTINHDILLSKLKYLYNFSDSSLEWIRSYLANRRQFVDIEGTSSNTKK